MFRRRCQGPCRFRQGDRPLHQLQLSCPFASHSTYSPPAGLGADGRGKCLDERRGCFTPLLTFRRGSCRKIRSCSLPGVDHVDAGADEVLHVARRHGHAPRARDGRNPAIRLRYRTPGGTAGSRNLGAGPRRAAVERKNPASELAAKHSFGSVRQAPTACAFRQNGDAGANLRFRDRSDEQLLRRQFIHPGQNCRGRRVPHQFGNHVRVKQEHGDLNRSAAVLASDRAEAARARRRRRA